MELVFYAGQTSALICMNILPRMHEFILFINGVLKKITRIPENPLGFLVSGIIIYVLKNYIRAFVAFYA